MPTPSHLLLFLLCSGLTALSSIFVLAAHTHHPILGGISFFLLVLLPGGMVLFFLRIPKIHRYLSNRLFVILCLSFIGIFGEYKYVTRIEPHPELLSAAPALIQPARRIFHGQDPYSLRLPDGAPISPGPGWIMLLAPLTLLHGAGLLNALGLLVVVTLLGHRGRQCRGVFLLLMIFQPVFVDDSWWGTDLFAIPLAFAALCLLADRWMGHPRLMLVLGLLAGIFVQSRIPMILLLPILALGIWRRDRSSAKWFLFPALMLCSCFYAFFYIWSWRDGVFFQPLHLFHREQSTGSAASSVGGVAAVGVLLVTWRKLDGQAKHWVLAAGLLMIALFVPTGLAELAHLAPDFRIWEGANYVSFGLSLFAVYFALNANVFGTLAK